MKKNPEYNPECFGKIQRSSRHCMKCQYREACIYWGATASTVESRIKLASFEEIQDWLPECADYDHIPGEENSTDINSQLISMLGRFFRFLLELDDYTAGIICEVVKPSAGSRQCTVSYLGKLHGCSRQAMHRKILDIIARKPELALLLKNTMYKLSRGRQFFIRRREREGAAQEV